jgi:peptide/nickel transport system permease protein
MAGLIILLVFLALGLLAPLISAYDPNRQDLAHALQPPHPEHLLGTDFLGRDVLTRLLYGARLTLVIGFLAVAVGGIVGVALGALSGYYGGWADIAVQRFTDILLSFPDFLLALSLVATLGVGIQNVVVAVGVTTVPLFIRVIRAQVLVVREQPYVEAARTAGSGALRILWKHVLANAWAPVIVLATVRLGFAILVASALGFLGLGVQPPTPEWGTMLGEGRNYIFNSPFLETFPGIAILLAVIAFNLLGDGLRDALDPRLRTL